MRRTLHAKAPALLLLLLSLRFDGQTSQPQLPDPGSVAGITKEQQEQLGLQTMAEVYKQMPVLPDSSPVSQYIQRLGKKLVPVIPQEQSWPYQFHVIPQKEINAFALPGGPIFINLGTIQAADNEAELAGVMAHEMSHVYMQHSAKQASKASLAQGILGVLGAVLPGGTAGNVARAGLQLGAGTLFLKYSRKDEAEADATGAVIMYKAGFDPKAMANFFEKLEQQGGSNGPQFLSDHPNPGNRVEAVDKEIQNWPPERYLGTSEEFVRAKQASNGIQGYTAQQIADGAKLGKWAQRNAQTGAIPPGLPASSQNDGDNRAGGNSTGAVADVSYRQIKPSTRFRQFDHPAFSISYPSNWQASGDQKSSVTIAPSAGVSGGTLAYGVIVSGAQDRSAGSIDQATQDLIQNLEQSNPGMHAAGNPQSIQVNGVEGRSVYLTGESPIRRNGRPLPERDWLVTAPRPQGGLLYLVFISPETQSSQLRSTYQKMLNSLQIK